LSVIDFSRQQSFIFLRICTPYHIVCTAAVSAFGSFCLPFHISYPTLDIRHPYLVWRNIADISRVSLCKFSAVLAQPIENRDTTTTGKTKRFILYPLQKRFMGKNNHSPKTDSSFMIVGRFWRQYSSHIQGSIPTRERIYAIPKDRLSSPKRDYSDGLIDMPACNRCDNSFTLYAGW
jgi:hypothetical protein